MGGALHLSVDYVRWANSGACEQMFTEKHEADWYKMRSITQQNDLDGMLGLPQRLRSQGYGADGLRIQNS